MAARAMWKGTLRIGAKSVAFKLYAAAAQRGVHFRLLHADDAAPVKQRMAHPRTGETIESDEVRRGVEVERGRFVILDEEELATVEPAPSRDVEVLRFVPPEQLDHRWYERPYYLGPDDGAEDSHAALVGALQKTGLEGVARWTMRKRRYVGALRVHAGHLALVSLRSEQEVIATGDLEGPAGRPLDDRERKLAAQLIGALAGPFDPNDYQDEYRERVMELVASKQKGERKKLVRFRPAAEPDEESLAAILEKSLGRAG